MHELGHWTGHLTRLAHDLSNPFGSINYAKDELRAEIASFMLGMQIGIGHDPGQHLSYVNSWIKALQDDPNEIFRACRDAQKIVNHILELAQEKQIENVVEIEAQNSGLKTVINTKVIEEIANEKVWLHVPFLEKDEAKKNGARWDKQAKSWYAPEGTNLNSLSKGLPENVKLKQDRPLDPIEEFSDAIKAAGLILEGPPIMDGNIHRVKVQGAGQNKDGAYKGYLDGHPAGFIQNFKTGFKSNWKATGQRLDIEQIQKLETQAAAKHQARERARESIYSTRADQISNDFSRMGEVDSNHPYLKNKGLESIVKVKYQARPKGTTLYSSKR